MAVRTITPVPLTSEGFAPFGEVIDSSDAGSAEMNDARFDRFDRLCSVDVGDGEVSVSIAVSRSVTELPYRIEMIERHPLGSQAFVPLSPCRMLIVVAPPGESVDADGLSAFESNGRQGVNYHKGTWHMPLISFESGQRYLVIDRADGEANCEEHRLDEPVMLIGA